jgi:hypothetical protein
MVAGSNQKSAGKFSLIVMPIILKLAPKAVIADTRTFATSDRGKGARSASRL